MEYVLTFLEGIMTFISPCILPLLPIYLSYFAGQSSVEKEKNNTAIKNALGFVIGFTIVFVLLGVFASSLGALLQQYQGIISIVFGIVVIVFGLQFMEIVKLPFLNKTAKLQVKWKNINFGKAILFGMVFSIGWTPCVGAFLGSALMMVASQGEMIKGIVLLLLYSIGLGIPFVLSAVLIEKLKGAFDVIKVVNIFSGIVLVVMGFFLLFQGYKYLEKEYTKNQIAEENSNQTVQEEQEEKEEQDKQKIQEESPEENAITAMNFTVYDAQNQKVTLQDFLGKPIVINYWATWCGYCVTDGVSETGEKAQNFIEEKGFQFPVYYDINGEVGYQYGIYSLPTTIFIHKDGTIEIGYKGMLPENVLRQEIQKIKE